MTEAYEIARNIIIAHGSLPIDLAMGRAMVLKYFGKPEDVGYQIFANVLDALFVAQVPTGIPDLDGWVQP